MTGGLLEFTTRVASNLRRSLEDFTPPVRVVPIMAAFGQTAWVIEVDTPRGTLVFNANQLDNGAEGIKEQHLVAIRQAHDQDVSLPNRYRRTDPYARFIDIIAVDQDE